MFGRLRCMLRAAWKVYSHARIQIFKEVLLRGGWENTTPPTLYPVLVIYTPADMYKLQCMDRKARFLPRAPDLFVQLHIVIKHSLVSL